MTNGPQDRPRNRPVGSALESEQSGSKLKMCLVCVRSVFTETNSSPAISGPLSSVASRRST